MRVQEVLPIGTARTINSNFALLDAATTGKRYYVDFDASATANQRAGYIRRNVINTVDICINDASGKFYILDNYCVTENAKGTAGAGAIVGGALRMLQNYVTCSDVANAVLPANGTL